jgi:hypothetical protein
MNIALSGFLYGIITGLHLQDIAYPNPGESSHAYLEGGQFLSISLPFTLVCISCLPFPIPSSPWLLTLELNYWSYRKMKFGGLLQ